MKYELIDPSVEIIEQYDSFWTKDADEMSDDNWKVKLFKDDDDDEKVDIRDYIDPKDRNPHLKYGKKDDEIRDALDKGNMSEFFTKINSIYHTRLDVSKLPFDKKWFEERKDNRSVVDEFIMKCKDKDIIGKYAYSFSTKVFSFIDPDKYPIVDSLVATMLREYLNRKNEKNKDDLKKSDWGNYEEYIKAYDDFKNDYKLNTKSYKDIDIFLWTYAIAIQEYWKKQGVLQFNPVTYKAK